MVTKSNNKIKATIKILIVADDKIGSLVYLDDVQAALKLQRNDYII